MSFAAIMLGALLVDAAVGWPEPLYRRIGHPVTWIGRLIDLLDRRTNRDSRPAATRRLAGLVAALGTIGLAAATGVTLQWLLPEGWAGLLVGALLAWPLLALRSMHDHVAAVARPLKAGSIAEARIEVAKIVGRDPSALDQAAIARAALESLAENTSDGIVAPVFWGALFGLPGLYAYKAINTLDSMIGHRTPRHEAFGWAAARIDDVANLVPARLTALLFALASGRPARPLRVTVADARHHRSPNAGWPEAALAGALDVRLSGPRSYAGRVTAEPWVNAAAPDPTPACVTRGLRLYARAMALMAAVLAALALV
jgi:adenosylcobinamide-phosphate synthase